MTSLLAMQRRDEHRGMSHHPGARQCYPPASALARSRERATPVLRTTQLPEAPRSCFPLPLELRLAYQPGRMYQVRSLELPTNEPELVKRSLPVAEPVLRTDRTALLPRACRKSLVDRLQPRREQQLLFLVPNPDANLSWNTSFPEHSRQSATGGDTSFARGRDRRSCQRSGRVASWKRMSASAGRDL